ncbi:MAG: hypothetical protein E7487_05485 [Ruminococcaceae bacterium]|nr:hypothetical protein [Oscillospiraceae bacterium]
MSRYIKMTVAFALVLIILLFSGCDIIEQIEGFINREESEAVSEESSEESEESESSAVEESSEPEPQEWPVTVNGIVIEEQPQSVVVLSPSLCEIMDDMGFEELIVGVGNYCDYPAAMTELPQCGTALVPDVEAIRALAPQYLFTSAGLPEEELTQLQQADIEVIVFAPAIRLAELEKLYKNLALFSAGAESGAAISEEHWNKCMTLLDKASEKAKDLEGVEKVIYLRLAALTVATADTLEGELITKLGFKNAAEKYGGWSYPEDDVENLLPDMIIADEEITETELEKSKIYANSAAVKQKRVIRVDMVCFERQGLRMFEKLVDVVEELVKLQTAAQTD